MQRVHCSSDPAASSVFSWRDAPDLMARLTAAQNQLTAPIDIVSFAGLCGSREELEAHVLRYEPKEKVA